MYKAQRNWENVNIAVFETDAPFDIPRMEPCLDCDVDNWIGFNFARTCPKEERIWHGIHFFVDDYQFLRLWSNAEHYVPMLSEFGAVMQPDFSIYPNFPYPIKLYNVYRNAWLGVYWQRLGIKVIPTVMWSTPDSYDWCFSAYPQGGVVATSSVGNMRTSRDRELFVQGYTEMLRRLHPDKIIFRGAVPDGCEGNIVQIPAFQAEMRSRALDKDAKEG